MSIAILWNNPSSVNRKSFRSTKRAWNGFKNKDNQITAVCNTNM
jgi:hypothetical protein